MVPGAEGESLYTLCRVRAGRGVAWAWLMNVKVKVTSIFIINEKLIENCFGVHGLYLRRAATPCILKVIDAHVLEAYGLRVEGDKMNAKASYS